MTIKQKTFKHYPEAEDVVEHLIAKTEKSLGKLEESKKIGIKFWNDERFAKYDRDRYNQKQLLNHLKELKKEIDNHIILDDVGREMSGMMDQEAPF
tara:strand:+ start:324 stop:611 length:288 start_codon:yes stop_codon:yes gene_type:complete